MKTIQHRPLPELTPVNTFFWTSGASGRLLVLRCLDCQHWLHPPGEVCPVCLNRNLSPHAVSGLATVETFTVNYQAWVADLDVPYVIAIVRLTDCPNVQLTTNLVGLEPAEVRIGMKVRCTFERHDDVWLPLFTKS